MPTRLLKEVFVFLTAIVALIWPMIYNGFPLYFSDSRVYTSVGLRYSGIPIFFNQIVSPIFNYLSPYLVPILFALVAYIVIRIFLSQWMEKVSLGNWLLVFLIIALFTRLPWVTSFIMPDILGGLGVTALLILLLETKPIRPQSRFFLLGVVFLSLLSQTSSLVVFPVVTIGVLLANRLLAGSRIKSGLLLSVTWLIAIFLVSFDNDQNYGRASLNANGPAIFFAKLVDHGLAQSYLRNNCSSQNVLTICEYLSEIETLGGRPGSQSFLWEVVGPRNINIADEVKAFDQNSEEIRALNWDIVFEYPLQVAKLSLIDSGELFMAKGEILGDSRFWWNHPKWDSKFMEARQQTGTLLQAPFLIVAQIVHVFSILGMLLLFFRPSTPQQVRILISAVLIALIANALIHATLVGPYARYQDKVTFIPILALLALWRANFLKKNAN